ncbi:MAG TPA: glycosyltransferase, partial [Rubrobacteraceae bacterium]|nr:glycosyltransferase [Rubrobacteraceae bacterium]
DTLFRVAEFLQRVRADVVYTDEDSVNLSGVRQAPAFKPYWSPEMLLSVPYIGRLCAIRRELLEASEGFRRGFEGAEEHDLLLRVSERAERIRHLPGVLYHRRSLPDQTRPGDVRGEKPSRAAVEDAMSRRGEDAVVEPGLIKGSLRVKRRIAGQPKVSVIVRLPDEAGEVSLTRQLERSASYPIHQLITSGSGPSINPSVDHIEHPFPARALNLAAERSEGEYLVFLDGRASLSSPDWLTELLSHAQRREVGAVGCKMRNPDGTMRHGGSVVAARWLADRLEAPVLAGEKYLPLVDYTFDFAAASAECMMIRRQVFEDAGGFDDENLPTAFYDLDLSFRLREGGLRNVYTPYAMLSCRGQEPKPGEAELSHMWKRWWEPLARMLFYRQSPLHIRHRGLDDETFAALSA